MPTSSPLPPGSTIGILGSGQLGRMLATAASRLGLRTHIYCDSSGPAFDVCAVKTLGSFTDLERIAAFAATVDVVTYEFENVPKATAESAARVRPVRPGVRALEVSQDRLAEKQFISGIGVPVAPFAAVDDEASLTAAASVLGFPSILKTRRMGYDGKGQIRLTCTGDCTGALGRIGHAPAVLEGFVPFLFEVSVLVVRGTGGETRFYDVPLNTHRNGILHTSAVPAPLPTRAKARALEIASHVAQKLEFVGVLAVEIFYLGETAPEPVVVNEIAPRVHNSGHWTLDACLVSQFENHIRAVAGWPLGATDRHSDAVMTNLIGAEANNWAELAAAQRLALHLYGKNEARPGRKMGHVTTLAPKSAAS